MRKVKDRKPKWVEGIVDVGDEHIKITHGDIENEQVLIALVAPAREGTDDRFVVEFVPVSDCNPAKLIQMREEVRGEIDFYLIEKDEENSWQYAFYHCGTAANLYSAVHWNYFPKRSPH